MKVQFFFDDEPTEIRDVGLMNGLHFGTWTADDYPEEGIDGLTGKFSKVSKVYFMDGTVGYVQVDMLVAIANGEYEVIEE